MGSTQSQLTMTVLMTPDMTNFSSKVHGGNLATFLASANYSGRSSMEIGIKIITENIREKSVRHTNSCFFTMVAVDDQGQSVPVPPLSLETPEAKRRHLLTQQRRAIRRELESRYQALREKL